VTGTPFTAQLRAFGTGAGTPLAAAFSSRALGDFMAGAPAVARRPGAEGRRVAVVPLPANGSRTTSPALLDTLIIRPRICSLPSIVWVESFITPSITLATTAASSPSHSSLSPGASRRRRPMALSCASSSSLRPEQIARFRIAHDWQ